MPPCPDPSVYAKSDAMDSTALMAQDSTPPSESCDGDAPLSTKHGVISSGCGGEKQDKKEDRGAKDIGYKAAEEEPIPGFSDDDSDGEFTVI